MLRLKLGWLLLAMVLVKLEVVGQQPDPPGGVKGTEKVQNQAYLFAHMTHKDYGRLYYSVSLDGLHWVSLNRGKRVVEQYQGHPDICKGHDGRYYMAGNTSDASHGYQPMGFQ